jgi:hypothetical protein
MIGANHHFFLTFMYLKNSPISPLFDIIYVPLLELVCHLTARLIASEPVTPTGWPM